MSYSYFQQASIEKIVGHFEEHNRVICADEAGLGKTYIARGVIEKMADEKLKKLLKDPNLRTDLEKWWMNFINNNNFSDGNAQSKTARENKKKRAQNFVKAVAGNLDLQETMHFKKLMKSILEPNEQVIEKDDDDKWFRIIKNLPNLLIAYHKNGERRVEWDFTFEGTGWEFPMDLKTNPFRVLYICSNLAIAEQNTRRLSTCLQRNIRKTGDRPDRLSTLWYYIKYYPTPYIELMPITYTIAKVKTDGTKKEREILNANLENLNEKRQRGEEQSLNLFYDLIIFDEFQNFGDVINLVQNKIPPEWKKDDKDKYEKLQRICNAIFPCGKDREFNGDIQKCLFLSATPFHDIMVHENQIRHIALEDIIGLVGGDISTYDSHKTSKEKADYLYSIGIFRNERKNMLGERYKPSLNKVPCTAGGIISQAILLKGEGAGNKAKPLIMTTPDAYDKTVHGEYTGISFKPLGTVGSISYSFDRYEKAKSIFCSEKADIKFDLSKCNLEKLLWIPPVRPSGVLRGVFAQYQEFSKSISFSNLMATPKAVCNRLNDEIVTNELKLSKDLIEGLKTKLIEKFFYGYEQCVDGFIHMLKQCGGSVFNTQTVSVDEIINYCNDGCLRDVLEEFSLLYSDDSNALNLVFTYGEKNGYPFAVTMDETALISSDTGPTLRRNFNSPFRPFVLMTTSIGTEGIDFHLYCDRLVHYTLPTNFVEWEQKNGRIDRRDSLAVRRWWAKPENFFELYQREKTEIESGGLSPHWNSGTDGLHYYYLYVKDSNEEERMKELEKNVREYRLVLGTDGRNLHMSPDDEVNLSPYVREKKRWMV